MGDYQEFDSLKASETNRRTILAGKCISFCEAYVKLLSLKEKIGTGEVMDDPSEVKRVIDIVNNYMCEITQLESSLNYNVGFPFNENSNFSSFSIRNGELDGDLSDAYLVATPWFEDFIEGRDTSETGFYKFFVGAFIGIVARYQKSTGYTDSKITYKPPVAV